MIPSIILVVLCSIIYTWAVCTEESAYHINRYDLGVQTIVKDSIEDVIFITDKYMTREEFIKRYIEKK